MKQIENNCVSCADYCSDCGLRRTEHFYCDVCGREDRLYHFDDKELCVYCVTEALRGTETASGICDCCGECDTVYTAYGLCYECLFEGLETVEGTED